MFLNSIRSVTCTKVEIHAAVQEISKFFAAPSVMYISLQVIYLGLDMVELGAAVALFGLFIVLACPAVAVPFRLAGSKLRDILTRGVTNNRANHGVAQTLIMSRNGRKALVMAYAVAKLLST